MNESSASQVMAFYQFVAAGVLGAARLEALAAELRTHCAEANILGTILLAPEGINGTVTGPREALVALAAWLRRQAEFPRLPVKYSAAQDQGSAFARLRIKIKQEIVSFGPPTEPAQRTGVHVTPDRFNELLADPDVVVIDTRNAYEIAVGTFPGAIDPATTSFREFPEFVANHLDPQQQPRVAMFCTGGIRCEKASSYLLEQGFESVYQLDGGVLGYLENVAPEANQWRGECFVFDARVALAADLTPGEYIQCHACRRPLAPADVADPAYIEGVSCGFCIAETDADRRAGFAERQRQIELADERGAAHIGPAAQPVRSPAGDESDQGSAGEEVNRG